MSTALKTALVAAFLAIVFVGVPMLIVATGRSDLYYTLTSVALLSIISAGVWITFYIGRINIGQGAFALLGGYVSAILVMNYGVSFWLTLPLAQEQAALLSAIEAPLAAPHFALQMAPDALAGQSAF